MGASEEADVVAVMVAAVVGVDACEGIGVCVSVGCDGSNPEAAGKWCLFRSLRCFGIVVLRCAVLLLVVLLVVVLLVVLCCCVVCVAGSAILKYFVLQTVNHLLESTQKCTSKCTSRESCTLYCQTIPSVIDHATTQRENQRMGDTNKKSKIKNNNKPQRERSKSRPRWKGQENSITTQWQNPQLGNQATRQHYDIVDDSLKRIPRCPAPCSARRSESRQTWYLDDLR